MQTSILGDSIRKSRYNPNLAQELAREAELEERRKKLEGKRKPEVRGEEKKEEREEREEKTSEPMQIQVQAINPREYIQVEMDGLHGKPVVISAYELLNSNAKNYENTHKFVLKQGLYMPTPRIFMSHFKNVVQAKEGVRKLFYADGTQVANSEIEETSYYKS
jgi:hypothetical protein